MAELARPPLSGSYLGNLARYPGLNINSQLANGLRELVQILDACDPGSPEMEAFRNGRRKTRPNSPVPDESATEASAARKNFAPRDISVESAVRALREHGFEVTLVAR